VKNVNQLKLASPLERELASLRYFDRKLFIKPELTEKEKIHLKEIQTQGYTVIENFVDPMTLKQMQNLLQNDLEVGNFEMPDLAQSKIDPVKHKDLIDNYLFGNGQFYQKHGIAFDREDFKSLDQVVQDFMPSTIKNYFNPKTPLFFKTLLAPIVTNLIENYFGVKPYLIEAYSRRNFKALYPVMNHYWHRDTNSPNFLLKSFLFLSNCELKHGPHYYVQGSHKNLALNGKVYYTEEEIAKNYDLKKDLIVSEVKAGTLILEDTRGLHKAGLPQEGFRDLVYGVFFPVSAFSRWKKTYYEIEENVFEQLDEKQKSYIPKMCVKG